ncbi:class II fructose-bisphosphate aldolase [Anaeromicrobium sediminis]|uniref:Fructose-bisphosphate aldolase n=1 Tax=Anaeromicrobium sediminis TaxID=1478221 RepID=A0A267MH89_9FIRM|nr:class II fructose-bisphosphate aldolase [Anaeromicrobium sediminis]PAB58245.1 fructose-bisphosphate aldolase [Anaeromicrobium sediminis]
MLVNMVEILKEANKNNKAVPGFNVFGYEDAKAVIEAAEELEAPVILMSNKDAVEYMDVKCYSALFGAMAKEAKVPVCVHLDHAKDIELIKRAIEAGYTSVMYDGSKYDFETNVKNTKEAVDLAKPKGVSVEAEIGSVAYTSSGPDVESIYTDPMEAKLFAEKTGIDAMAVSIGTVHRMEVQGAKIQYDRLKEIEKITDVPLVLHGSSGVVDEDLYKLATEHNLAKVNIGTALRMVFGNILREEVNNKPEEFDRLKFFVRPTEEVKKVALNKFKLLGW